VNWEAIGAIGELLSAVAVLVTLIYLAVQVRNARTEMQHSVLQYRDQTVQTLMLEQVRNPLLLSAYAKAAVTYGSNELTSAVGEAVGLTQEEAQAYSIYYISWWFYRAETIRNIEELSPSQREDFDSNILNNYSNGLGKVWFEAWKGTRSQGDPTLEYCLEVLRSKGGT
jgi:hypothetical protein